MKTAAYMNIFDSKTADAVCVTTNGIIKTNGEAVMGAGIAKEADRRYNVAKRLGNLISHQGNHVFDLGEYDGKHVITFPTKNNWRDKSDPELIKQSCEELVFLVDAIGCKTVLLPPVGCGCGGLDWKNDVFPLLSEILDDRFIVCLPSNLSN